MKSSKTISAFIKLCVLDDAALDDLLLAKLEDLLVATLDDLLLDKLDDLLLSKLDETLLIPPSELVDELLLMAGRLLMTTTTLLARLDELLTRLDELTTTRLEELLNARLDELDKEEDTRLLATELLDGVDSTLWLDETALFDTLDLLLPLSPPQATSPMTATANTLNLKQLLIHCLTIFYLITLTAIFNLWFL